MSSPSSTSTGNSEPESPATVRKTSSQRIADRNVLRRNAQRLKAIAAVLMPEYSALLNNLGWHSNLQSGLTLGITSSRSKEGVSTVATQLAICAAEHGAKVLLIDANSTRPNVHHTFRIPPHPDVADFLNQGVVEENFSESGFENLKLIPCGSKILPSIPPSELESIFEKLESRFDVVIFDLPSLEKGPQVFRWCSSLRQILLVVSSKTTVSAAANSKRRLEKAGGFVAGVVENQY